jgi:hypothetical protein
MGCLLAAGGEAKEKKEQKERKCKQACAVDEGGAGTPTTQPPCFLGGYEYLVREPFANGKHEDCPTCS